jgi:hypothetical protein
LPPRRRNSPVIAASFDSAPVGAGAPRSRAHTYRIAPATAKRAPAIRNGGSVSTAKRMKRYVDPQMT